MTPRTPAALGFALVLGAWSIGQAWAADDAAPDEADVRAFLKGKGEGSLANPIVLDTEARVEALCRELQGRRAPGKDSVERSIERHELKMKAESARRAIYHVRVGPKGFRLGDYDFEKGTLPLRLEQQLVALDGAVTMAAMEKRGAQFKFSPKDASALVARIDKKEIALDVEFRLDAAKDMSPCFSAPKSAAYALRIEPLSYGLVEAASSKPIAQAMTPPMEEMKAWLEPGNAKLRISVGGVEGALDADQLATVLEAKKQSFESCLAPVMKSSDATAVLGFSASVAPNGALQNLHLDVEAIDHPEAIACVEKALGATIAQKSAKGGRAQVTIAVERGED